MSIKQHPIKLKGADIDTNTNVSNKINEYAKLMNLSMELSSSVTKSKTTVTYREVNLTFSQETLTNDINSLYKLMLKINPKTGKICKCNNCDNCPSKRIINNT